MATKKPEQRDVDLAAWVPDVIVPSEFRGDSMYEKSLRKIKDNGTVSAKFKLNKSVRIANDAIQKMIDSCV